MLKNRFVLLVLILFSGSYFLHAEQSNLQCENVKKNIEITDKHNQITLGIKDGHIYMIINEAVKKEVNEALIYVFNHEKQLFLDSQGGFLPGEPKILSSRKIDYTIEEVKVTFDQGLISFNYLNDPSLKFEEITHQNGKKVLSDFYLEDLERFALTYKANCL